MKFIFVHKNIMTNVGFMFTKEMQSKKKNSFTKTAKVSIESSEKFDENFQ